MNVWKMNTEEPENQTNLNASHQPDTDYKQVTTQSAEESHEMWLKGLSVVSHTLF